MIMSQMASETSGYLINRPIAFEVDQVDLAPRVSGSAVKLP